MTKFGRVTTEVSSHHVYWQCNKQAKGCGEINDMALKQCKQCSKTRCAGDDALDALPEDGKTFVIGYLDHVDENGEHWCYKNPNAQKQSQII